MQSPVTVRINAPDVINQTIDGETIVLHLGTGRYYSARGSGAHAWDLLSRETPVDEVVRQLAAIYDASADEITVGVEKFVTYLMDETLVTTVAVDAHSPQASTPADRLDRGKALFEAPAMESFSDLEDLLLLDPVHEVDPQQGWPYHPAES